MLKTMEFQKNFENNYFDKQKVEKVQKLLNNPKCSSITFTDFDDTLVSRIPQFKSDERFVKNRWEAWIKLVYEVIWLKNFLEKYYSSKVVVKDILNKTDIILTAWKQDIQKGKLEYTNIDKEAIIVEEHKFKPEAILDYILEIWQIPESIIFIDDKAFKLEKEFEELSKILQTKIILQNIKLDENDFVNNYEIEEKIFWN